MEEIEIQCRLQQQMIDFSLDLLIRQPLEIKNKMIIFPTYISIIDLNLYCNFLASGYINAKSVPCLLRILSVADFLCQRNICNIITNLLIPFIDDLNCLFVLHKIQNFSIETYSEIHPVCSKFIFFDFRRFINKLDYLSPSALENLFEEVSENQEISEILLEKIKNIQGFNDFLEFLVDQEQKLENSELIPELELTWKFTNAKKQEETDIFEFKSSKMSVFLNCDEKINVKINEIQRDKSTKGILRGIIILQGISHHFFFGIGSNSQLITETSKKTRHMTLKLVLKEEKLLYRILQKAASEIFANSDVSSLSKSMMLLLLNEIKPLLMEEEIISLISNWYSSHGGFDSSEILDQFPWRSKNIRSVLAISQKFPVFKQVSAFRNYINEIIMNKGSQPQEFFDGLSREIIPSAEEENICSPLSNSGNPFNADISEIQTAPGTDSKFFFQFKGECNGLKGKIDSTQEEISENEATLKKCFNYERYSSPKKFREITDNMSASELLKKLKKKLESEKPHKRNRSFIHFLYPMFDNYQHPRFNF